MPPGLGRRGSAMSKRPIGFSFASSSSSAPDEQPDPGPGPGGIEAGPQFKLPNGGWVRMSAAASDLALSGPGPVEFLRILAQTAAQPAPPAGTVLTVTVCDPNGQPALLLYRIHDAPDDLTVVTAAEFAQAEAAGNPGGVN